MDVLQRERDRGMTIDTHLHEFEKDNCVITAIDTAGHSNFIGNMITGVAMADTAVLVVSSASGEFEVYLHGGLLLQHALIAFTFGVRTLIVAVNKMDDWSFQYSKVRYDYIEREVSLCIGRVGFLTKNIKFVPLSARTEENVFTLSDNMPWYKGPALFDMLPTNNPARPERESSLRIVLHKVYDSRSARMGAAMIGKIRCGTLRVGDSVTLMPSYVNCTVDEIKVHHKRVTEARAGQFVGFHVVGPNRENITKTGRVALCVKSNESGGVPVREFVAKMVNVSRIIIRKGYTAVLDVGTAHVPIRVQRILNTFNKRTGAVIQEDPPSIGRGAAAQISLVPLKPVCLELFVVIPSLGRFLLRDQHRVVGVGLVMRANGLNPNIRRMPRIIQDRLCDVEFKCAETR